MERLELLVKNVPKLTPALVNSFKIKYGAVTVRSFGRCRVVLQFPDERCTHSALQFLHQSELDGRVLSAEYLGRRRISKPPGIQVDEPPEPARISEFVKTLYATSARHGFEQPPPPHLKYNYPPINRTILDSISIALLTNPKFYHQVLHLMNRMNLEPPFLPLEKPFIPPGEPCDAQTQTDFELASKLLASDESELESDDESIKIQINKNKRKKPSDEHVLKNKVRKIISAKLHEKSLPASATIGRKEDNIHEMFENNAVKNFGKKIALNVATVKLPEKQPESDLSHAPDDEKYAITPLVGDDLKLNRISEQQWKDLAIFKNYQRGEKSNKLYVKNLNKDVTAEDLVNIYSRFVENFSQADINVKLMLYGKMKGQAFVTFNTAKEGRFEAVQKALNETNGYILKNKPMVVCYAKKS